MVAKAWETSTHTTYGSGLRAFHLFCDSRLIHEGTRAPVLMEILSAFVAHLTGTISGQTIILYVNGIRAWHMLHSLPWRAEPSLLATLYTSALKLTPVTSRCPAREPLIMHTMGLILTQLNPNVPLDATVYSCLTTIFLACSHLREFTVPSLMAFNGSAHISWLRVRTEVNWFEEQQTVFALPQTKTLACSEDVY